MVFVNPIIITTVDGQSAIVRPHQSESVADVKEDIIAAIVDMYDQSGVVLEEFIECGELQIDGVPLNLQVEIFCELKERIDGDEIYIESSALEAFPTMKLNDYLVLGPTNDDEEFPSAGLYYYGNSMKEALSNPPVEIKTAKQLIQYEATYTFVIATDDIMAANELDKKEDN